MTWRRAAVYWGCFVVLAAYYLAVERGPAARAAAHLTRAPFLDVPEDRIEALELRRGDVLVRCRRVDGRWRVAEPPGANASSDLITGLINNLTQLPDVEVVAERAGDLTEYGLSPPVSQLVLTPAGGKPISIRLGTRNPAGTAVYAQRSDSPRVFLIGLNVRYYEDLLLEGLRPRAKSD